MVLREYVIADVKTVNTILDNHLDVSIETKPSGLLKYSALALKS
jgi:hypothetical protein